MPWAMPAILTVLVGTGAILRRGRHERPARIVMIIAMVMLAAWIGLGVLMAFGAIA